MKEVLSNNENIDNLDVYEIISNNYNDFLLKNNFYNLDDTIKAKENLSEDLCPYKAFLDKDGVQVWAFYGNNNLNGSTIHYIRSDTKNFNKPNYSSYFSSGICIPGTPFSKGVKMKNGKFKFFSIKYGEDIYLDIESGKVLKEKQKDRRIDLLKREVFHKIFCFLPKTESS